MLITSAACAAPWLIALRAPFGKTLILKEIPDLIALFAWIEEDECVRDDTIRIAKIAPAERDQNRRN
jgi:hypothetical protein